MSLILDYTHSLAGSIGATHGLTDAEVDTLVAKFPKYHESVEELRANGAERLLRHALPGCKTSQRADQTTQR